MAILEARGLSKEYRMGEVRVSALSGVDLAIERGEFVAVMGPSGSGKSTLLYLLGGLDVPTSGEVILAGQRISALSDDQVALVRRRNVGFIFQFYNLLPTLSAEENIALPLLIDGQDPAAQRARIEGLLELVGLAERRHHRPDQLSGGEQQRVAIARALVTDPHIVLADEPTGNLDSATGWGILELLRRSCDARGQTILLVTHDPKAASYADRLVFLKDGKLVDEMRVEQRAEAGPVLARLAELGM